jgi:hypothetical protein
MIGVEARNLRPGDEILGFGVVESARCDSDGDIAVRFVEPSHLGALVWFGYSAWLRIERKEEKK